MWAILNLKGLPRHVELTSFRLSNESCSPSSEDHDHSEKRAPEFKIPAQVNDHMKKDFRLRFSNLTSSMDRDARVFVHTFIMDVIKCANVMSVDELSERVQRQYQVLILLFITVANGFGKCNYVDLR